MIRALTFVVALFAAAAALKTVACRAIYADVLGEGKPEKVPAKQRALDLNLLCKPVLTPETAPGERGHAMTHYRDWGYEVAGLLLVALLVAMVGLYFHWGLRGFGWLAVVTVFVGVWLGRAHIGVLNDIPRPPETVIGKSLLRGDDDEKHPSL